LVKRRVKLIFPSDLITEPIIYLVSKNFEVVTNIRRANVTSDIGWVVLEVDGEEDVVNQALRWAEDKGVVVEPVEGDVIAG
jgi:ABC-type methionine transport system ATPase subunit